MPEYVPVSRYADARERLEALPSVGDVELVLDRPDLDQPCLEVHVHSYERVPPCVLRTIAESDLGLRPDLSGTRPGEFVLVVV